MCGTNELLEQLMYSPTVMDGAARIISPSVMPLAILPDRT